jgi:hypothetical protein
MLNHFRESDTNALPITSVHHLPFSIQDRLGFIADTGEDFEPTCLSRKGVPHQRFLGAVQTGKTVVVASEQGGAGYGWLATAYILDGNGRIASEHRLEPLPGN